MIEKIKEGRGNTEPCTEVLDCILKVKETKDAIVVGEIGVDLGATAVEILKSLNEGDEYHFFDREFKIKELVQDFRNINTNNVMLYEYGNSDKTYDFYGWPLCKLYKEWNHVYGCEGRFDVVYLDGAHTFIHDASTVAMLKEMISRGGYLILDDLDWKMNDSPTCNPEINPLMRDKYTDEQLATCQVQLVADMLLDTDKRFEKCDYSTNRTGIYLKC